MSLSRRFQRLTSRDVGDDQNNPGSSTSDRQQPGVAAQSASTDGSLLQPIVVTTPSESPAAEVTPIQSQPSTPRGNPPAKSMLKRSRGAARETWSGLTKLVETLGKSGALGPLHAVFEQLAGLAEMYERIGQGNQEYEALQEELENLFEDLHEHLSGTAPQAMTRSMRNLCREIESELKIIKSKAAKRRHGTDGKQVRLELDYSNDVLTCYQRIRGYVQRITLNANLSIWKITDEHVTDAILDRLAPVMAAIYNSAESTALKRGECAKGTRIDVLAQMHSWVYSSPAGAVYWLNGMAGTGKTTIAFSLCDELGAAYKLGASFFCSHLLPECRDVNRMVHECDNKDSTRQILDLVLSKAWALPIRFFVSSRPEPQVRDQMVLQGGLRANKRLVLHELDKETVQADIATYLRSALAPMLPLESELSELVKRAGVLFIYAATAVRFIGYDNFHRNPHARLETILNAAKSSNGDENREIDDLYSMILKTSIGDPHLVDLDRQDMRLVLHTVVCAREPLSITALSGLLKICDIERVDSALRPLWSVLHVMEQSSTVTTLHASFSDYIFDPTRSTEYHCSEATHNQFLAHLCLECINRTQPRFNICNLESSHLLDEQVQDLAERTQLAISTELFYASRYWATHLIFAPTTPEIDVLLNEFLTTNLLLWMEVLNLKQSIHLGAAILWQAEDWCTREGHSDNITELVHDAWRYMLAFASSAVSQSTPHINASMLPFWPPNNPVYRYYAQRTWRTIGPLGSAMDNRRLSILASWVFETSIESAVFSPDTTQIVLALKNDLLLVDAFNGQHVLDPLRGHSKVITSVDYSNDGSKIVSGSEDFTIRLWDPQSGGLAIRPILGHTQRVTSVKFSPDGTTVASGSYDKTVRLWNVHTGASALDAFVGHAGWVTTVRFSHNNMYVVSGSSDRTIRVWNTTNGQSLFVLKGHSSRVTSVDFSSDDSRIISGSFDRMVRIWDAQSGKKIGRLLKGHDGAVTTITVSTDGRYAASGSEDMSIRVWELETGKTVLGPLEMHTSTVKSVAFSVRGDHLISTSDDKTLKVWDIRLKQTSFGKSYEEATQDSTSTPKELGRQIQADTVPSAPQINVGLIYCVAFSPDGSRVISGSTDGTVRVWDSQTGISVMDPLQGHTKGVWSVMFSPDGSRIASGSEDSTIRIWDSHTGLVVVGPLRDHTAWVRSVAFSHDGSRIVSGSDDKTIRVWDSRTGLTVVDPIKGSLFSKPLRRNAFMVDPVMRFCVEVTRFSETR